NRHRTLALETVSSKRPGQQFLTVIELQDERSKLNYATVCVSVIELKKPLKEEATINLKASVDLFVHKFKLSGAGTLNYASADAKVHLKGKFQGLIPRAFFL